MGPDTIRAVIVDDERLARDRLKQLLARHPHVEVVGEADRVETAVAVIDRLRPRLLFLDVDMGQGTGFDVLERTASACHTIFVTAYSEHATRAFDVQATDYLLKPVTPERLTKALERLTSTDADATLALDDHVCLIQDHKPRFVRVRNIVSISAAGPYTEVRTTQGALILVTRSTQSWERALPAGTFRRVHRSTIVNVEHVEDADPLPTGGYRLRMRSGPPLLVSRRYAALLRREKRSVTQRK